MHLAILMANTDDSAFARAHPSEGETFTNFIQLARPDWTTEVHMVRDNVFPDPDGAFDGVMITGSPASARSDAPWVTGLLDLIRRFHANKTPMFGACFGHQAIAQALGGSVGWNPSGWVHGIVPVDLISTLPFAPLPPRMHLCACHSEQVTSLPDGARNWAASPDCVNAGLTIGQHVLTTQLHPEMTEDFFVALTEELAEPHNLDLAPNSRATNPRVPDQFRMAETVARFFEAARQD